jgi:hypothetical protein
MPEKFDLILMNLRLVAIAGPLKAGISYLIGE